MITILQELADLARLAVKRQPSELSNSIHAKALEASNRTNP